MQAVMNGTQVTGFFLSIDEVGGFMKRMEQATEALEHAIAQVPIEKPDDWLFLEDVGKMHSVSVRILSERARERGIDLQMRPYSTGTGKSQRQSSRLAIQRKDIIKVISK